MVTLYDAPTLPDDSDVLLTTGIPVDTGLITRLNCFTGPVPPAFEAERLMVNVPFTVGVPLITPEVVLMLKPEGRPEALKLVGLFVAEMVTL